MDYWGNTGSRSQIALNQINVIVNDFTINLWRPLLVIGANVTVLTVLFVLAYKKKGLTG